jgi:DNA-binding SARP family transcriptional activator
MTEPVGGFSRPEFDRLDATDPRRHHPVVVVQPPGPDGTLDNLYRISERATGNGDNWPQLLDANRGLPQPEGRALYNPSLISPGQVLYIPDGLPVAPAAGSGAGAAPVGPIPGKPGGLVGALAGGQVTPACAPPALGAQPVVFTESRVNWAAVATGAGGVALGVGAAAVLVKSKEGPGKSGKSGKSGKRGPTGRRVRGPQPPAHGDHRATADVLTPPSERSHTATPGNPASRNPHAYQPGENRGNGQRHDQRNGRQLGPGVHGDLADTHRAGNTPTDPSGAWRPHDPHGAPHRPVGARHTTTPPRPRDPVDERGNPATHTDDPDSAVAASGPEEPAATPAEAQAEAQTETQSGAQSAELSAERADPREFLVELGHDPTTTHGDHVIADLASLGGLGISGPVATMALCGLLATVAHTPPAPGQRPAELLADRALATRLFGPDTAAANQLGPLLIVETVEDALNLLEMGALTRGRQLQDDPLAPLAPLVLFTEPTTDGHHRQLAVLLATSRNLGLAAVVHTTTDDADATAASAARPSTARGGAFPATRLTLTVDGTITGATGPAEAVLRGTRMPLGTREPTLTLLTTTIRPAATAAIAPPAGTAPPVEAALSDPCVDEDRGVDQSKPAGRSGPADPDNPTGTDSRNSSGSGNGSSTDTADDRTTDDTDRNADRREDNPARPDPASAEDGPGKGGSVPDEPGWSGAQLCAPTVPETALLKISCLSPAGLQVAARTGPDVPFADLNRQLGSKRRLVLCVLCTHPGGVLIDDLLEAGWPEASLVEARGRLQAHVSQLRMILRTATNREDWITLTHNRYRLLPEHTATDLHATEQTLSRARGALNKTERRRALTDAAQWIAGPLASCLDGEWIETERERRRRIHLEALHQLVDLTEAPDRKITLLSRAFRVDATDEHTTARLITELTKTGEHDQARRIYHLHAEQLHEIDLTPTARLTALAATEHPPTAEGRPQASTTTRQPRGPVTQGRRPVGIDDS